MTADLQIENAAATHLSFPSLILLFVEQIDCHVGGIGYVSECICVSRRVK